MVRRSAASHWSPGARLLKVSQAFWSDTTVVSEWRCPESFSGNLVWYRRRTGMKCSHWLMTVRCSKSFPSTLVRCSCGVRYGALHWTLVVWYLKASQASWFDTVAVSEMTCSYWLLAVCRPKVSQVIGSALPPHQMNNRLSCGQLRWWSLCRCWFIVIYFDYKTDWLI